MKRSIPVIVAIVILSMSTIAFSSTQLLRSSQTTPPGCVAPPTGLVSWWPADGDALDIVGGNHGTLQNGATFASGMVGQAFSFDGVDDIVIAPTTGLPAGASPRTAALWVKVDHLEDYGAAFGYDGEYDGGGFHIFPVHSSNGGRLAFTGHGSAFDLFAPNDLRDNQYHHVAVTYNSGGTVTIYVDGVAVASGNFGLNTGLSGGVGIGGRTPLHTFLHGEVDEVAVWNRTLSASEIQAMFSAGSAGMCKTPSAQPTPTPTPNILAGFYAEFVCRHRTTGDLRDTHVAASSGQIPRCPINWELIQMLIKG